MKSILLNTESTEIAENPKLQLLPVLSATSALINELVLT